MYDNTDEHVSADEYNNSISFNKSFNNYLTFPNKNKIFDDIIIENNEDDNDNYHNLDNKDSVLCLKAKDKNGSIDLVKSANIKEIIDSFICKFNDEKNLCRKSYIFYYIFYHVFFVPIGILSLVTAILSFLITSKIYSTDTNYYLTVLIGCMSIITAFGHSCINYFKLGMKKDMFREAINDYGCLIDRLQFTELFVGYDEFELVKSIEKKMLKIKSRLKYSHPFNI